MRGNPGNKLQINKIINERNNFWEVVPEPFLKRDLKREEVKEVISMGLRLTKGSYMKLLRIFNIQETKENYKKLMGIIRTHKLKP